MLQAASAQCMVLMNGTDNVGTIEASGANQTNSWSFSANTGDNLVLRLDTTNFAAVLSVYSPNGALLSTGGGEDILSILVATNAGTFTAVVTSYFPGDAGSYVLRLAEFAQPFVTPATPLTNGGDNNGNLELAGLDRWTFTANPGDDVLLRLEATNFVAILNLYDSKGTLLSNGAGADVLATFTATNHGTFTALVTSYDPHGEGSYILRLAQAGQPFVTPSTTLTNGSDNSRTLGLAELDRWTFTASAGDNVLLRLGTTNFIGILNVYGPNGTRLSTGAGEDVPSIFTAGSTGNYTALVTGFESRGVGDYALRLAQFAQPFVTPSSALINGAANNRVLSLGGLDRWTFTANAGDNVLSPQQAGAW